MTINYSQHRDFLKLFVSRSIFYLNVLEVSATSTRLTNLKDHEPMAFKPVAEPISGDLTALNGGKFD